MPSLAMTVFRLLVLGRRVQTRREVHLPVEQRLAMRRARDQRLARIARVPRDIRVEDLNVKGTPAKLVIPPGAPLDRVIYYLHGGAFVQGSFGSHGELTSRIARATGAPLLFLSYRLAPEHPFPAALSDATRGYEWLLDAGFSPSRIAFAGDSAGAGLALSTLVKLRDQGLPLPAVAALMSPWADLTSASAAASRAATLDPMLTLHLLQHAADLYAGPHDKRDPLISPLYADLTGLPPLLVQVGTHELLYEEGVRVADRARVSGVPVTLEEGHGLMHVYQVAMGSPEAVRATLRIGEFLRAHLPPPDPVLASQSSWTASETGKPDCA